MKRLPLADGRSPPRSSRRAARPGSARARGRSPSPDAAASPIRPPGGTARRRAAARPRGSRRRRPRRSTRYRSGSRSTRTTIAPVARRELDRVDEEVPEDLLEAERIGADRRHVLRQRRGEEASRRAPSAIRRTVSIERATMSASATALPFERERAAVEARQIEQVVDQREQQPRRLPDLPQPALQRLRVDRIVLEEIGPARRSTSAACAARGSRSAGSGPSGGSPA